METHGWACATGKDCAGLLADFLLTTVPRRVLLATIATDGKMRIEQCEGILLDRWLQVDG
jgi:hypothetical protein